MLISAVYEIDLHFEWWVRFCMKFSGHRTIWDPRPLFQWGSKHHDIGLIYPSFPLQPLGTLHRSSLRPAIMSPCKWLGILLDCTSNNYLIFVGRADKGGHFMFINIKSTSSSILFSVSSFSMLDPVEGVLYLRLSHFLDTPINHSSLLKLPLWSSLLNTYCPIGCLQLPLISCSR